MEPDLSAKLARSQASLQHIITVIMERMVAVFYILYSGRPGYVTCCGIIGSAMFYIGGYLLSFPPPNILSDINDNNDINIYYLASNILPFETFVHIALLFLASITYWKVQNILSFCMVKCGCFYLFIHSIFSLILLCKYLYTYSETINYAMIIVPSTFICWFLFASLFGFVIVSKQHAANQELKYKWKQLKNSKHQNKNYQQLSSDEHGNENEAESQHQCDEQFVHQQYWSYYIYILLALNVLWYISYSLAQCINNLNSMRQCGPDSMLTVGAWIGGYTQSFTQCFHHAFILSCIYNIVFRPWCHNTVYIAMGATATSFLLHAGYLLLFLSEMEWEADRIATFHSLSLGLISSKTGILSLLLVCERKLYHLLPPKKEYNKHEMVRKRPTMFDILSFDGMTGKQRKALHTIIMSSTFFFVSMHLEIIFMLCASTFLFREHQNPWLTFNAMLLWSFHLCTVYVHAMVVSVQFSDSFVRASRLLASLNVSLLIFAIWNICYVSYAVYRRPTAKYVYLDYIVIGFCLLRCLASFGGWIGFSKLKTIQPFSMPVFDYDAITENDSENDKKRRKLPLRYVWGYAALLLLYFVACLYRYEWDGNLFALNGCDWPIICSDTPLYGLLFHSGLLNIIFIFDGGISKRWAPTWDLSRLFLASIAVLGAVQIVNCLVLYCGDIYAYNKCEIALLLSLLVWMAFSLKMGAKLHALDNLFLYKRKIFI